MRRSVPVIAIVISLLAQVPAQAVFREKRSRRDAPVAIVTSTGGVLAPAVFTSGVTTRKRDKPSSAKPGKERPGKGGANRTIKKGRRFSGGFMPKPCVERPSAISSAAGVAVGTLWSCLGGRLNKTECSISVCFTTVITLPPTPGVATPNTVAPAVVIPEPDIPGLIESAREQIPLPQPMMSPPFEDRPKAEGVAGIPIYFAVNTDQWRPFSATATDGFYHVTVTATPLELTFDSGLGGDVASCDGPGVRITRFNWERRDKAKCTYTYQESTREGKDFDASVAISWTTSVVTNIEPASRVTNLVDPLIVTTTNISIPIVEIQAVLQ
jgi:hypothetical protein